MATSKENAFTLIELSIVLVIIGLIIGGVLVGKDLIKAAEIRATVQQIEKYNTALYTFKTKYGGLPGDLKAADAAAFGMFSTGMTGTAGKGDGNGLIQSENSAAHPAEPDPNAESLVFWRHLSDAQLIEGNYGKNLASEGYPPTNQTVAEMKLWMPTTKLGRGSFAVTSINGKNYYEIYTGLDGIYFALYDISYVGWYSVAPILTPFEVKAIDQKIDDGMPASGVVKAASGSNSEYMGTYPDLSENCTSGSSPDNYNVGGAYQNSIVCNTLLEIK